METRYDTNHIIDTLTIINRDALASIRSKRGCTWVSRLIVASVDAVMTSFFCWQFYTGKRRVLPHKLLSAFMQKKNGLIDRWIFVHENFERLPLPDQSQIDALQFVTVAFDSCVNILKEGVTEDIPDGQEIVCERLREMLGNDTQKNRDRLKWRIAYHVWRLAETAYRLSIVEYRIWHEHREWKLPRRSPDPMGVPDDRRLYDIIHESLKEFDLRNRNAFKHVRCALTGLMEMRETLPFAFVSGLPDEEEVYSFASDVRATLTLSSEILIASPGGFVMNIENPQTYYRPCVFLSERRKLFIDRLLAEIQKRARRTEDLTVRRMWYEAAAALLAKFAKGTEAFTEAEADRVIALADAAQRESWIRQQLKLPENAALESVPSMTEKEPRQIVARLDADTQSVLAALAARIVEQSSGAKRGPKPGAKGTARNGRRGSGLHGSKTQKMDEQLSDFRYCLRDGKHPVTKMRTISYWAANRWREKAEDYEAAAKAAGERRGYASSAKLAGAYRSWLASQSKKRANRPGEKSRI